MTAAPMLAATRVPPSRDPTNIPSQEGHGPALQGHWTAQAAAEVALHPFIRPPSCLGMLKAQYKKGSVTLTSPPNTMQVLKSTSNRHSLGETIPTQMPCTA